MEMDDWIKFAMVVFLTEWDIRTLYQMSRAYAAEAITARDKFAIPPIERKE